MGIELTSEEATLRDAIAKRVEELRKAFSESRHGADIREKITETGALGHRLHLLLKKRNLEPKHHAYMIQNRGMKPDAPEFYAHFHPLEDLLAFVDNPHANDDPIDSTLGEEFSFRVYSRRWDHEDTYTIRRTADGWDVSYMAISGPCDRGGQPVLYRNFDQDSIQYPEGLPGWMEWLWDQAATKGLTRDEVQEGLQDLANWVSNTEKNSPHGHVWDGYS